MKKFSLRYSIAGCFKVFVRNPVLSLAALCLLTGTLLTFSFTYAVTHNIDSISENEGNVCVFLSDECDDEAVKNIHDILVGLMDDDVIDEIDYLSKSESLEEQKQRYPEYSKLFATFTPDDSPFKASYTVSVVDEYDYSKVRNALSGLAYEKTLEDGSTYTYDPIYSVYDDGEAITEIESAGDKLVGVLGVLIPLMLLVCVVLISAVVRMGIFDQREEIALMRIIGSTHTYISAQFVIEGISVGLASSALTLVVVRMMYNSIIEKIADSVKLFTPLSFSEIAPGVIILCVVLGIFTGVAGSLMATSRYIRRD